MTIRITGGPRIRRNKALEDINAPFSDVIGATWDETVTRNPLPSMVRMSELEAAELGRPDMSVPQGPGPVKRLEPDSPMLGADEARERVASEGLDLKVPDEGIRKRALDILMERKREERRRASILSRSGGGFSTGAVQVATALAGSAMDPLNVASAFIPVVGEMRYARLLAAASGPLGRAGVRAGVGAVEGAFGAAVVEPIVYSAAESEQADYDMTDSLMNVAFGTVMGGGLHMGGGALSDALSPRAAWKQIRAAGATGEALSKAEPQTREALLRASVAQMVEGRHVNIEAVAALDPLLSHRMSALRSSTALSGGRVGDGFAPFRFEAEEFTVRRLGTAEEIKEAARTLEPEAFRLADDLERQIEDARAKEEEAAEAARMPEAEVVRQGEDLAELNRQIEATTDKRKLKRLERKRDQLIEKAGGGDVAKRASSARATANRARSKADDLQKQVAALERKRAALEPRLERATNKAIKRSTPRTETKRRFRQVQNDAVANGSPQSIRLANFRAAEEAQLKFDGLPTIDSAKEARAELDGATEQVVTLAERLGLDEALDELSELDDLLDQSQAHARAVRAAAFCELRR